MTPDDHDDGEQEKEAQEPVGERTHPDPQPDHGRDTIHRHHHTEPEEGTNATA